MSQLHRDVIEKYHNYFLGFRLVELDRNHYLFHLISNNDILITGTGIPIATYDLQKNVLIWSDSSQTLDKAVVKEVRNIRKKLVPKINNAAHDFTVITHSDLNGLLFDISEVLKHEILIDETAENMHIYLVKKILTDDR